MIKFISEILNSRIILFQEGGLVGTVKKLIIDPATGDLLGLVAESRVLNEKDIVPIGEIKAFGVGFIVVDDLNSFSDKDDVVRIKEALKVAPGIKAERVFTENNIYLGKVADATIDVAKQTLERLYVNPPYSLLGFSSQLLIPAKKIVEIQTKKIIVSDEFVKANPRFSRGTLAVNK